MRVAISGSHGTGKSTLIAAFLEECPHYLHEPEAYELLADDIDLSSSEGPDSEGLGALLKYTLDVLAGHRQTQCAIFERSPVDYLAYVAASDSIVGTARSDFLSSYIPSVRAALQNLDLILLLPVSSHLEARSGEDEDFRDRVDHELRRALIDDDYDLFQAPGRPVVQELPASPDRRLSELLRRVRCSGVT